MDILFWIYRSRLIKKTGFAPLMLRITCEPHDSIQFNTGLAVDPPLWNVNTKRASGNSAVAELINKYIIISENKLIRIQTELMVNDIPCTSKLVMDMFNGTHIKRYGLLQILDIYNESRNRKSGQDGNLPTTLMKYTGLKKKIQYFLEMKYNRKEMYINELNLEFIENFWHFLMTTGKEIRGKFTSPLVAQTACQIIKRLKAVGRTGFRKEGIPFNPWDDFKCTFKMEQKETLNIDEIKVLMNKKFKNERLSRVRDRFLIGIFTGLANSDIQSATVEMVGPDGKGNIFLTKLRVKTGKEFLVPLWQPVLDIIEKYKNEPATIAGHKLFMQISLNKMNAYLREVSALCGIEKKLTTHLARRTFADLYINSGGSYDKLSKIMGHSDPRTTSQIYATLNKSSIAIESNVVETNIFNNLSL